MKQLSISAAALCVVLSTRSLALDFYVTPFSSGTTPENTFDNLELAQAAVRKVTAGMEEDITVHIADSLYLLDSPLNFTSLDSGQNGHKVHWKATGSKAIVSGGIKVNDWSLASGVGSNVYSAPIPKGVRSRNLFVNGWAANYARRMINRSDFKFTSTSITWTSPAYDWIMDTPGISGAGAEVRAINSFTDRYAPIQSVGYRELKMKQTSWANNIIGYDTIPLPNEDFGFWLQNAVALLTEGGQHFVDSSAGIIYYKPLAGENMATVETYLGRLEALITVGESYDRPAHDITFEGLNFQHTTWLKPSNGYGYVDQQTGGYIGDNATYLDFEASRPKWHQMPSAIQISAAERISFTGGSYTQLGSGGIGIGNDETAYLSNPGLGAHNISVADGYFTQIMGNSITAGGVQADAHHPSDPRMTNSGIVITNNIFYNISSLYSSTVSIFASYVQYSEITHNDIFTVPYSGICHGYGWGANDAGGSQTYIDRGLYNYQPLYQTPTTSKNNLIDGNLIHAYGLSHTDLGSTYTLSKSPDTHISGNYALNSSWFGMYTDEGSNSYIISENTYLSNGNWYAPNEGCLTCGVHNGNNTLMGNFGHVGADQVNKPNGSANFGNTFINNLNVQSLADTSEPAQRVAYRAGVLPSKRGLRQVSNPDTPDSYLSLAFTSLATGRVQVSATLSNFDDVDFTQVSFTEVLTNANGYTLAPTSSAPQSIPANARSHATWELVPGSQNACTGSPTVSVTAKYTNPRTGKSKTIFISETAPGMQSLPSGLSMSTTWPGTSAAQLCSQNNNTLLTIRSGGRDIYTDYDDWTAIYKSGSIGGNGAVSAQVLSVDAASPWSKAGVVVRNNLVSNGAFDSNAASGYAAVFVTPGNGVSFQWDANGDGKLDAQTAVVGVKAPLWVRLGVDNTQFSGFYSSDGRQWTQIGWTVNLSSRKQPSDAGIIVSSHAGYSNSTGLFGGLTFT
ncbi:hypothetical protein V495_01716 [Pseudogymnoascus sp. VKM F-4514 (FW-929)]|nr:hypothetical protein V495_01716 [Pseudogymnoascus sp. VKM F-4514 (FW-929)]KFY63653.1 hypothetical protein V497_01938 [Pseudogymnoascus sp. VKM F-4516 (FW-969)]